MELRVTQECNLNVSNEFNLPVLSTSNLGDDSEP